MRAAISIPSARLPALDMISNTGYRQCFTFSRLILYTPGLACATFCRQPRWIRGASAASAVEHGADAPRRKQVAPPTIIRPPNLPEKDSEIWLNGVLLVDKPLTWTSHDVCNKLKYSLDAKKIGHAGTLDPLATGLLIVCVGKGTKSVEKFMAESKEYSGVMRLGESTPSYDAETDVDARAPWQGISDEELQSAATTFFTGDIQQMPPIFSAIKVKGRKMYEAARNGEEVQRQPRPVTVETFTVHRDAKNPQDFRYWIRCSKGTYVRSLIHDLGKQVGSLAYVRELRRETSGEYRVDDAWNLDELVALAQAKGLGRSPKEQRQRRPRMKKRATSEEAQVMSSEQN